jgi:superfamily II DNA or RNA helicase
MVQLRDYQNKLIAGLTERMRQGKKRLILCAPTGAGKTVMFSYMVSNAVKKGKKVLVLTHRKELLKQAGGTFSRFDLYPELIEAGIECDTSKQLHVGMVETVNRRLDSLELFLASRDLIIIDEAHLQPFNKLFPYISKSTFVIGATATPHRDSTQNCLSEFYEDIVQEVDTLDLIDLGFLSKAKSYGVEIDLKGAKKSATDYDTEKFYEENRMWEGVILNYERYAKNKKTILFSSSVNSSKRMTDEFVSKGYNARHIDGTTPKAERNEILQWFDETPNAIICNCGILTAGFDQPDIDCVILYRATTSLPLFLQMCGRGSRVTETKKQFTILDFGNNIKRLGFWERERKWELKRPEKKQKETPAPVKECPDCGFINHMRVVNCVECGYEFKKAKDEAEEVVLQELKFNRIEGKKVSELSLDDLIFLQGLKKVKATFIWRVVRSRGLSTAKIYAKMMNYNQAWIDRQDFQDINFHDVTVRL